MPHRWRAINAFAQHRKGFPDLSEATAVPNSASLPLATSSTTSAAACSNKQRDSTIARQRLLPLPLQRHGRLSRVRAPLLKPARRFSRLKLACEKRVRAQKHRAPSLDLPQRHHHHRQVKASATALECSHNSFVSRRRAQQNSRMLRAAARVGFQAHRHCRLDVPTSRDAASPSSRGYPCCLTSHDEQHRRSRGYRQQHSSASATASPENQGLCCVSFTFFNQRKIVDGTADERRLLCMS